MKLEYCQRKKDDYTVGVPFTDLTFMTVLSKFERSTHKVQAWKWNQSMHSWKPDLLYKNISDTTPQQNKIWYLKGQTKRKYGIKLFHSILT